MEKIRAVKGMNDLLPTEVPAWRHLEETFRQLARQYGFSEVRTPLVEPTALFTRSIGEATDIVEKEMYSFVDKGNDALTLRPEGTASAVRAYLEHNLASLEPVTKWVYLGPMYRRERPAKGRLRQFHQAGSEVYGDGGPYIDAEVIDFAMAYLAAVGVTNIRLDINSLGGEETRTAFRNALVAYFTPLKNDLCGDCQRRLESNPLRILDCKVERCKGLAADAPTVLAHLNTEDLAHFEELKATLTALGVPYNVNPRLVRGLDYYNRTLFEIQGQGGDLGAQSTLCGGGRYDGLVRELGGPATPAFGFGIGLERLLLAATQTRAAAGIDVFICSADPASRLHAVKLAKALRSEGLSVDLDLRGQSLKSQLRRADKSLAPIALVLGESELARGVVQAKDMRDKSQQEVPQDSVVSWCKAHRVPSNTHREPGTEP